MSGEIFNQPDTGGKPIDSNSLNLLQLMPDAKSLATPAKLAVALGLGLVAGGGAYLLLHGHGGASAESALVKHLDGFSRQLNDLIETGKSPYITGSTHGSAELMKSLDGVYTPSAKSTIWIGRAASEPYPGYTRIAWENPTATVGPTGYSVKGELFTGGWDPFQMRTRFEAHDWPAHIRVDAM
jgi:hypothetical protein